jgi:hypothetical protein
MTLHNPIVLGAKWNIKIGRCFSTWQLQKLEMEAGLKPG